MATAQLQLIYTDHTWKLDQRTVQVGRAGLAQARAALAAATAASIDNTSTDTAQSGDPGPDPHQAAA